MKKLYIALASIALLSTAAFASGEHCVSRTLSTNYNDGLNGAVSKQCFSSESGYKAPEPKKCDHETKRS